MKTSTELRLLARGIENLCRESHCHSIAWPVIRIACDHLTAIAKIHELNTPEVDVEVIIAD
jgi:hypothetical protein